MRMTSSRASGPLGLAALLATGPCLAHVKWFASWDILCPPRPPESVMSKPLWLAFFAAAVIVMGALALLDRYLMAPGTLDRGCDRVHRAVLPHALLIVRVGLCAYWLLAALTLQQPVYLTPELTAPHWVTWVQLACAALVLHPGTSWLAGAGLVGLYGLAIADHGWFHLLDYPLFLAIGVMLMLPRLRPAWGPEQALTLLRWGAAVTLLWGGIEKFAYPEWSYAMLSGDPVLSLGVAPEVAMYMYGFGEVALSFGLLLFRTGSQVSALLLLAVFVAAIPPFGWIDLVGHSGIIVALVVLTAVRPQRPLVVAHPVGQVAVHASLFASVLVGLLASYSALHSLWLEPAAPGLQAQGATVRVR